MYHGQYKNTEHKPVTTTLKETMEITSTNECKCDKAISEKKPNIVLCLTNTNTVWRLFISITQHYDCFVFFVLHDVDWPTWINHSFLKSDTSLFWVSEQTCLSTFTVHWFSPQVLGVLSLSLSSVPWSTSLSCSLLLHLISNQFYLTVASVLDHGPQIPL